MWTTLKKRSPHAHSHNKCKCQARSDIDQEAAVRFTSIRHITHIRRAQPTDSPEEAKKSVHAAEQDRPDVAAARKALRKEQLTLDPKQLIFIDETAATTKMTRLYGRAPQGKRLVDKVPHGHWKTTTFICGLRYDGVTAPFVLDGPMDGLHFLAYVEQILAPTLKKGQIVFLDNVSTHKVDGVEEAIEARGARPIFLPAYSPDLNPIEQLFARLKSFLRKMKARTEGCARES